MTCHGTGRSSPCWAGRELKCMPGFRRIRRRSALLQCSGRSIARDRLGNYSDLAPLFCRCDIGGEVDRIIAGGGGRRRFCAGDRDLDKRPEFRDNIIGVRPAGVRL